MLNYNPADPGLYFALEDDTLLKVGPAHVGANAPNSGAQGFAGYAVGEQWLDTSAGNSLKTWDGANWLAGSFALSGDSLINDGVGVRLNENSTDFATFPRNGSGDGYNISGNIGFGTDSATHRVSVDGGLRLLDQTSYPAGNLGALATVGGSLVYHNGSTWINVLLSNNPWQTNGNGIFYDQGDVLIGPSAPSSPNIQLKADGSATFVGPIGVGTTNPSHQFQVHDPSDATVRIQLSNGGTGSSGSDGFQIIQNGSSQSKKVNLLNYENSALGLWTNNSERLQITSSGNVLIGGALPSAPNIELNADGSATFDGTISINSNAVQLTSTGNINTTGYHRSNRTSGSSPCFQGQLSGSTTSTISADGSATFVGSIEVGNDYLNSSTGNTPNIRLNSDIDNNTSPGGSSTFRKDNATFTEGDRATFNDCTTLISRNGDNTNVVSGSFMRFDTIGTTGYFSNWWVGAKQEVGNSSNDNTNGSSFKISQLTKNRDGTATDRLVIERNGEVSIPSTTRIGGTLPSAPNIELNADGSATFGSASLKVNFTSGGSGLFGSDVYVGGNAFNGTLTGVRLNNLGIIYASAGASQSLWKGYTTGSSVTTSSITADGSATFGSGNVKIYASGLVASSATSPNAYVFSATTGTISGSNPAKAIITAGGSATFAGSVLCGGSPSAAANNGAEINPVGLLRASRSNNTDNLWIGYKTGNANPTSEIFADGSATFAGDITCSDNSKGLVLKSPDGTSFRLSVANDGTLSASSI